jgi:hypothetical protein
MKSIILVLLFIGNLVAQNLSVVVDDGYIQSQINSELHNINKIKKHISLLENKKRNKYDERNLLKNKKYLIENKKRLFEIRESIKPPFGLLKWHLTPFKVMQNICQNQVIAKIGFLSAKSYVGEANDADLNKQTICKNLTVDKVNNLISEYSSGFAAFHVYANDLKFDKKKKEYVRVFNKQKWNKLMKKYKKNKRIHIDDNGDRFYFENLASSIAIVAKYVTINNMDYVIEYIFDEDDDLNSKLYLEDKEKLKTSYFKFRKKKYYTYYALTSVRLTCKADTYDLEVYNFNEIAKILSKKYNKYNVPTKFKSNRYSIGTSENGHIIMKQEQDPYYTITYSYYLPRSAFEGKKIQLLQEFQKKNNKGKTDSTNQL